MRSVLDCRVCHSTFNHTNNQPVCLMPCGHTFCRTCADSFGKVDSSNNNHGSERSSANRSCPLCHQRFNQIIPDYEMIDVLNASQQTNNDTGPSTKVDNQHDDKNKKESKTGVISSPTKQKKVVIKKKTDKSVPKRQVDDDLVNLIMNGTKEEQLKATKQVRKQLSKSKNPPVQEVIDIGLLPKFVEFLNVKLSFWVQGKKTIKALQYEAAWAVTNIASGNSEQTKAVVECGAVAAFGKVINESDDENLLNQAFWALSNIAGDNGLYREIVLNHEAVTSLVKIIENPKFGPSTVQTAIWCLSNLCRQSPPVPLIRIRPAFPLLKKLIEDNSTVAGVLVDACCSVKHLCAGSEERIQEIIDHFGVSRFIELLYHANVQILPPCLHIICNIASGNETQTQLLLDHNVLPALKKLLGHEKSSIRKETCWTLSNITGGTSVQIQQVIDADLIPQVAELYFESDEQVKKEIIWTLRNPIEESEEQTKYFIDNKLIEILMNVLIDHFLDRKLMSVVLDTFKRLFKFVENPGSAVGKQIDAIVRSNGLEKALKELVTNSSQSQANERVIESLLHFFDTDYNDGVKTSETS